MKLPSMLQQLLVLSLAALAAASVRLYLQVQQMQWHQDYYHGTEAVPPPPLHH